MQNKEGMYGAWEDACARFETALDHNPTVQKYLQDRGLKEETIRKFRIGFAPDSWNFLSNPQFSEETGCSNTLLFDAGLIVPKQEGGFYDRFRNRVVFPVFSSEGRIIGATARAFNPEEKIKYINGPETPIYSKGKVLFGLHQASQALRHFRKAIFVEGAFDLVLAHQEGFPYAVAPCGTALTREQVELVEKENYIGKSGTKILLFDGDDAGLASAERVCLSMLDKNFKVARMFGKEDPADVLKNPDGRERINQYIKAAGGSLVFLVDQAARRRDVKLNLTASLEDKIGITNELSPALRSLPQDMQGLYTYELARILKLNLNDVLNYVFPSTTNKEDHQPVPPTFDSPPVNPTPRAINSTNNGRSSMFYQSQFIRILVGLAKKERAKNGLAHLVVYCENLGVRPLLTMPEAKAAFDYIEHHLSDLPYEEIDTPLLGTSALERVCGQIQSKSTSPLDQDVLQRLFNTSLIAYPPQEERVLNQDLLNQAIADLLTTSIHSNLGKSYAEKKISLKYMSDLDSAIKRGNIHGKEKR